MAARSRRNDDEGAYKGKLTPELVGELLQKINPATGKRYTGAEIGRMYGVHRSRVNQLKQASKSYRGTKREEANRHFPWVVPGKMGQQAVNKRLHDHGEYVMSGGKDMSPLQLQRLRNFYETLQEYDVVVEYDPEIPPRPGMTYGGFEYRQRESRDGNLIIRVNEHTNLTPEGAAIWTMPSKLPEV